MQKAWWTLLPVHGIATGKSRLAAVLDAPARAALNHHLLTHTLEMIAAWQGDLAQCLVVSPCAEALACAEAAGALTMREAAGGDLNAALRLGAQALARRGAQRLLVLACDLPRLSAPALDAFTAQATRAEQIVLAADRAGSGTNALASLFTGIPTAHEPEPEPVIHAVLDYTAGRSDWRSLQTLVLDRDRRLSELLFSLLFTLKGSPVLYYGDEVQMGDNLYLGDRDSVRTPMQWSPDRNGGFSRADFAPALPAAVDGPDLRIRGSQRRGPAAQSELFPALDAPDAGRATSVPRVRDRHHPDGPLGQPIGAGVRASGSQGGRSWS